MTVCIFLPILGGYETNKFEKPWLRPAIFEMKLYNLTCFFFRKVIRVLRVQKYINYRRLSTHYSPAANDILQFVKWIRLIIF